MLLWSGLNWNEWKSGRWLRTNTTQRFPKSWGVAGNCCLKRPGSPTLKRPRDWEFFTRKSTPTTNTSREKSPRVRAPARRHSTMSISRLRARVASAGQSSATSPRPSARPRWTTTITWWHWRRATGWSYLKRFEIAPELSSNCNSNSSRLRWNLHCLSSQPRLLSQHHWLCHQQAKVGISCSIFLFK